MQVLIYQPKQPRFFVDKSQRFYDKTKFNCVYADIYDSSESCDDKTILEFYFRLTNVGAHPAGFTGHSLSVGDIVELDDRLYICANIGWQKVAWKRAE